MNKITLVSNFSEPGIGHSTSKRLASMGIATIQDLLDASQTVLESEFGKQQACTMQQLAQGIDNSVVTATGAPQVLLHYHRGVCAVCLYIWWRLKADRLTKKGNATDAKLNIH